jgi:hypothetical protein
LANRRSPVLDQTAENIGAALGQVAAKLHSWKKQRTELVAEVAALAKAAQAMLTELGHPTRKSEPKKKGGRQKGYVMPDETKAKLREAWARRKQTADRAVREHTKPGDVRASIRAKEGKKFTARQRGRG